MRCCLVVALGAATITACAGSPERLPTQSACPPLPPGFNPDALSGTWVAEYFGGLATDTLTLQSDGHFKQEFSSEPRSFETTGMNWWFETTPEGFGILHLESMRRCDDIDSICDHLGGGLPTEEVAIDQCRGGYLSYAGESILFVTGAPNLPRGIQLQHPRLAGSEWIYTFILGTQ